MRRTGWRTWITWASGVLTLVGLSWGGFVVVDDRYAKAAETQQQIDGVKQLYLQSERRAVQREKFQIEVTRQQRKLTPIEQQRLEQLTQEEKDLTGQLQRVGTRER